MQDEKSGLKEFEKESDLGKWLHIQTYLVHSEIGKQNGSFSRDTEYEASVSLVFSMNDFHVITNFEKLLQFRGREIQRFLKRTE